MAQFGFLGFFSSLLKAYRVCSSPLSYLLLNSSEKCIKHAWTDVIFATILTFVGKTKFPKLHWETVEKGDKYKTLSPTLMFVLH